MSFYYCKPLLIFTQSFPETRARLIDKDLLNNDVDIPSSSNGSKIGGLRKSLALREKDPKYEGKVVSRKELDIESDDSFDDDFEDEIPRDLNDE